MKTNQKALFIFLVWQRNKEEIKELKHTESMFLGPCYHHFFWLDLDCLDRSTVVVLLHVSNAPSVPK